MLERLDATIVAIASPPGAAPVGIVRLSGSSAISCADATARLKYGARLTDLPGSRRAAGDIAIDDEVFLPAAYSVFRAPHSYTREDMVEIHTLGSPVVLEMLRRRLLQFGATPAEPGEFTARAFLNGALDLGAAESVAAVIQAQSDAQLRAARRLSDGRVAAEVTALRNELAEVLALVEAGIDFVEEPIEFITAADAIRRLSDLAGQLDRRLADSATVESLNVLPRILLLGPPNAGKSSLLNRLSGTNRAICAAVAGTTRDILSAPIHLDRGDAMLLDSAGIDAGGDEVIAPAQAAALSLTGDVDLICLVVDLSDNHADLFLQQTCASLTTRALIAANKVDLLEPAEQRSRIARLHRHAARPIYPVSALCGDGLNALRGALGDALATQEAAAADAPMLTERQRLAVLTAQDAVNRARALLAETGETGACADLLAFELREALDALAAVSGAVTTEDLLGRVFARFCIGK